MVLHRDALKKKALDGRSEKLSGQRLVVWLRVISLDNKRYPTSSLPTLRTSHPGRISNTSFDSCYRNH